ncbi:hypothetical protein ACGF13_35495 [Kitasatospora sp. NPDC048286]|uniref:hypothetical protein n=1 Tax=Kitasatospora sp. NPDC048286 TaxID=3364047 RepID=UPI00372377E1
MRAARASLYCRCPTAGTGHGHPLPRPAGPYEGEPIMVKHYLKYAFSTLTAAMFLHMV